MLRPIVSSLSWYPDPEVAFLGLFGHARYAFWLDSTRAGDDHARFSYMGSATGPLARVARYSQTEGRLLVLSPGGSEYRREDIFTFLRRELARVHLEDTNDSSAFWGGYVGYFGYELKALCGGKLVHRSDAPDAAFIFADRFVVFDHLLRRCSLVCLASRGGERVAKEWLELTERRLGSLFAVDRREDLVQYPLPVFRLRRSENLYTADIERCQRFLHDGESYEICLTNQLQCHSEVAPLAVYRALRRLNPAPYAAFLRLDDLFALSSSPERFLKIDRTGLVEAKPIKGTVARRTDPRQDRIARRWLESSEKNRAENLMIVDLLRNDLGRVCEVGSISVPQLMAIESYETVHQMVSTIRGRLRPDRDRMDCIAAAFPGGSMTGAPKIRTMEIIDSLEPGPRGVYSGALGFLSLSGEVDLSIVIRTLVKQRGQLSIGCGGAITVESDAQEEFDETMVKALPLMRAVAAASSGAADPSRFDLVGCRTSSGAREAEGRLRSSESERDETNNTSATSVVGARTPIDDKARPHT